MTPDEAQRELIRLGIDPERVRHIRMAFDEEARRIRELKDPPGVVNPYADDGWYTGAEDDDRFWPAIIARLRASWEEEDIESLDRASSKVLGRMRHPMTEEFTTRGLVVGHVQSGKTTNFTSVIAKAADRDYRFFIVLSGIHNSLREQTQERLEADLVKPNQAWWIPLTEQNRDFTPPPNATAYLSGVRREPRPLRREEKRHPPPTPQGMARDRRIRNPEAVSCRDHRRRVRPSLRVDSNDQRSDPRHPRAPA